MTFVFSSNAATFFGKKATVENVSEVIRDGCGVNGLSSIVRNEAYHLQTPRRAFECRWINDIAGGVVGGSARGPGLIESTVN